MDRERLLSAKQCAEFFGIHRATWYRWAQADPTAPEKKISAPRYARWSAGDILDYKELLARENRSGDGAKGKREGGRAA